MPMASRLPNATHSGTSLLLIEDDLRTAELVSNYLQQHGFKVTHAADGVHGSTLAKRLRPALIVLDLMLPGMSGYELCSGLRSCSDIPVIVISARDDESDRLRGFAVGADDYLIKPFSLRELVARAEAILRRTTSQLASPGGRSVGNLHLEVEAMHSAVDGQPLALTVAEFRLLDVLTKQPGRVFSRAELLDALHPDGTPVVDRVVDVHIGKLRKKLRDAGIVGASIATVRGVGYQLAVVT